MNFHCASVRPDLKAFADGELALLARLRIARHLKGCSACQKELTQMQILSEELKPSETEPALSPELRAKILANAPVATPLQDAEVLRRRRRVARKKTVLALGAASLMGGLLWVGAQNGNFGSGAPTMSDSATTSTQDTSVGSSPSGAASGGAATSSSSSATSTGGAAKAVAPPGASSTDVLSSRARGAQAQQNLNQKDAVFSDSHSKSSAPGSANEQVFRSSPPVDAVTSAPPPSSAASESVAEPIVPAERAVHREGSLSVAVDNAEKGSDAAQNIIKNVGGFVASASLDTGSNEKRTATLDCRVPVDKFETVVSKIGALGTVRAKSLSGQDITAQVAQSNARSQTLQQQLSIAQAQLDQKEKNAKKRDAGAIYELRSDVREARVEAAQARAQLETLHKYGNTSSLWVSLQDRSPVKPTSAGWTDSLGAGHSATFSLFLNNARVPFQLLLLVLAYSPIWLPALLLWRKFGRKWLAE